jgi:hypothetical protein
MSYSIHIKKEAGMGKGFIKGLSTGYHDFRLLGLKTKQNRINYPKNQRAKESIIIPYIERAIIELKLAEVKPITFAELFCADGYYAMFARKAGVDYAAGFDTDQGGFFENARKVRDYLGLSDVDLIKEDVTKIDPEKRFSIVANVGGLYHVADPRAVLLQSYRMAEYYLIVQSAVSMATQDEDYYVSPGPGQNWGNRFCRESFDKMMNGFGWKILDRAFNELEGNRKIQSRGSVYYLIDTQK